MNEDNANKQNDKNKALDEGKAGPDLLTEETDESLEDLKNLPPEARRIFRMISATSGMPIFPPYLHKINEGHIDRILDIAAKETDYEHMNKNSDRKYNMAYTVIVLFFIGVLIRYLVSSGQIDLLKDLIHLFVLVSGGIGIGGGYIIYKFYIKQSL